MKPNYLSDLYKSQLSTPPPPFLLYDSVSLFPPAIYFRDQSKAAKMELGDYFSETISWKVLKLLGRGSYGTVYLAVPSRRPFKYPVALKVASLENSSSLVREKEILDNFRGCPEIVQCPRSEIYASPHSFDSGSYGLVLEYAAGGTLSNLIKQQQKLPENEVKVYLKMILKGLYSIHLKGFVHTDLKPNNILVFYNNDGKKQLKIADFGISRRCKKVVKCCNCSVEPKFKGTPIYMSPESVVFCAVNSALDIWSLGCILIEMISGKPVWSECKNSEELMKKLAYGSEIPDIPEELSREGRDFLAGCFDHNFERRWTTEMLLKHPYLQ